MCVGANCKCSPLFYKDITGRCLSFTKKIKKIIKNNKKKEICNNATATTSTMSCVIPNEDETFSFNPKGDATKECNLKNELPCFPN